MTTSEHNIEQVIHCHRLDVLTPGNLERKPGRSRGESEQPVREGGQELLTAWALEILHGWGTRVAEDQDTSALTSAAAHWTPALSLRLLPLASNSLLAWLGLRLSDWTELFHQHHSVSSLPKTCWASAGLIMLALCPAKALLHRLHTQPWRVCFSTQP